MASCPACTSSRLVVAPASRATGRRVLRCRDCGARFSSELRADQPYAPTATIPLSEMGVDDFRDWVGLKREQVGPEAWREAATWLRETLGTRAQAPRLYDVGAGDGHFLAVARDEFGFEVSGNEVVEAAVHLAKERYDVTMDLGDLSELGRHEEFDAVTLWCVLAHVSHGDQLLSDVRDMLRPGGLVFLQTPHWTKVDSAAHTLQRATAGRVSKLPDRRVAEHHMILHSQRSIEAQLTRLGFTDVVTRPQLRYSLTSRAYLASMNPPQWTLRPASWLMDRAIASPMAPRIVLDVVARKP